MVDSSYISYIVAILTGLATAIPLVINLIKYVQKAVKEKNWNQVVKLVMNLMKEAEKKFDTGAEKKEYVMSMIKASADTINYDIDIDAISDLIDSLCSMSKVVNAPTQSKSA